MQVRKLISWLSEQLKQFWPAWLCFDSGFVVTHKAHVAINSTDHTLWEGNETGLPKGCQVLASAVQTGAICYQSIFSNDQHCLHLRSCSAPSHPLNPLTWRSPFCQIRLEDRRCLVWIWLNPYTIWVTRPSINKHSVVVKPAGNRAAGSGFLLEPGCAWLAAALCCLWSCRGQGKPVHPTCTAEGWGQLLAPVPSHTAHPWALTQPRCSLPLRRISAQASGENVFLRS